MRVKAVPHKLISLGQNLKLKKLSKDAKIPTKTSNGCYDLYTTKEYLIQPRSMVIITIDIAIQVPHNIAAKIVGLANEKNIHILNDDCQNRISIFAFNSSYQQQVRLEKHQKIAQLHFINNKKYLL